ncbi:hypothetical protein BCR36DRAFT_413703 [Piromyces finnis]|uniref:Uncharacterized protein n=1 Tax=Piromyces finnis TaxID=1754191 RepID=A0A1Y1V663_9FUNG|nr:hypothetical protein BCR36DRAFT_413703 [Piromyces finnis]|eukprot:ORX47353.1 hypothetical protein BCR36DRAFT_413703 [Piromyces finnis]
MEITQKIKLIRVVIVITMFLSYPYLSFYGIILSAIILYGLNKGSVFLFKFAYIVYIIQTIVQISVFIKLIAVLFDSENTQYADMLKLNKYNKPKLIASAVYSGLYILLMLFLIINFYILANKSTEYIADSNITNEYINQNVQSDDLPAYTPEANILPPYSPPLSTSNLNNNNSNNNSNNLQMINNTMNNSSILPYPPTNDEVNTNTNPFISYPPPPSPPSQTIPVPMPIVSYPPSSQPNQAMNIPISMPMNNTSLPYPSYGTVPINRNIVLSANDNSTLSSNNPFIIECPPQRNSLEDLNGNSTTVNNINNTSNDISPYPQNDDDASIIIMPIKEVPYLPEQLTTPVNINATENESNVQLNTNTRIHNSHSNISTNDDFTSVDITTVLPSEVLHNNNANAQHNNQLASPPPYSHY